MQRARQGLQALQQLQYAEDHPLLLAAKQELAALEAEEQRSQPPEVLLRGLQQRLTDAKDSLGQTEEALAAAETNVAKLRSQQEQLAREVRGLEGEVIAAQRAVAASAAGPSGVDLAGIASNLVGLQALLNTAPARVAQGQSVEILEAINSQVLAMGAAFPAARALQAAAPASGAPVPQRAPPAAPAAPPTAGGGSGLTGAGPAAATAPAAAAPAAPAGGASPGSPFLPPAGGSVPVPCTAAAWENQGMEDD